MQIDETGKVGRMLKDGKIFRTVDENCWNLEKRVEDMDKTGRKVWKLQSIFNPSVHLIYIAPLRS